MEQQFRVLQDVQFVTFRKLGLWSVAASITAWELPPPSPSSILNTHTHTRLSSLSPSMHAPFLLCGCCFFLGPMKRRETPREERRQRGKKKTRCYRREHNKNKSRSGNAVLGRKIAYTSTQVISFPSQALGTRHVGQKKGERQKKPSSAHLDLTSKSKGHPAHISQTSRCPLLLLLLLPPPLPKYEHDKRDYQAPEEE